MKQKFTSNLAYLIEDIVRSVLESGELELSGSGLFAHVENHIILFAWADLRDIAYSPDIENSLKKEILELLKEYDEDEDLTEWRMLNEYGRNLSKL